MTLNQLYGEMITYEMRNYKGKSISREVAFKVDKK